MKLGRWRRRAYAACLMVTSALSGAAALESCDAGPATTAPDGAPLDGRGVEASGCGLVGEPCCENASCGPGLFCQSSVCRAQPSDAREEVGDAGTDATADAATDADVVAPTYSDFLDASAWSTFDGISPVEGGSPSFCGGAFDGRFVYMSPKPTEVAQYDTSMGFDSPAAWSTLSIDQIAGAVPNGDGFGGAVFDGRYALFVPPQSLAVRYDTLAPFTSAGSWSTFDTTELNDFDTGFSGGVFDGRYIYFVPQLSRTVRYDTRAPFDEATSWSDFDVTRVATDLGSYQSGLFDGRYVYFLPTSSVGAAVLRFDTHGGFESPASWTFFAVPGAEPGAEAFGGAFDGRYIYVFAAGDGTAVRYDTTAPFTTSSSWETMGVPGQAAGAAFDGRYVYVVPGVAGSSFARYDTSGDFSSDASWQQFGGIEVSGFCGAVFDGEFVYFIPSYWFDLYYFQPAARFDAKKPRSLPKGYSGSFF
jgi:hypothetical protein